MEVDLILADFAEVEASSGKVHILGAGWSLTGPAPSPQAVVAFLRVPAERVGSPLPLTLRLLDQARQVVEVPGLGGMQPLEIFGQVEMKVPESWDQTSELAASFAVNLGPLSLKPGGYTWILEVDGKEEAHAGFLVRSA